MKTRYAALFSCLLLFLCTRAQYQQDWLTVPNGGNGEDVYVNDAITDNAGNVYVHTQRNKRDFITGNYTDSRQVVTKVTSSGTVEWAIDVSDTYLPQYNYYKLMTWRNGAIYTLSYGNDSIKLHRISTSGNYSILYSDTIFKQGYLLNYELALYVASTGHLVLQVQSHIPPEASNRILEFDQNDNLVKTMRVPGLLYSGYGHCPRGDAAGNLYAFYIEQIGVGLFENHVVKYLPSGVMAWDTIFNESPNSLTWFQVDSSGNFYNDDSTHFTKFDTDRNPIWSYPLLNLYVSRYVVLDNGSVILLVADMLASPASFRAICLRPDGTEQYNKPVPFSNDVNSAILTGNKKGEVFFCSIYDNQQNIIGNNNYGLGATASIYKLDTAGNLLINYQDRFFFPLRSYASSSSKIALDENENIFFNYRFRNPQAVPYGVFDSVFLNMKDNLWFSTKYCTSCRHNIVGDVRLDTMSNCIADSTELAIDKMLLRLNPNEKYAFSNLQGKYRFAESDSGTHTVTILPPDYFLTPCDTQKTFTLNDTIGTASPDFVLQINPDCIGQLTTTGTRARYGFTQQVNLRYRNTGYPPQSGFVSLQPHSNFSYVGANPPADSVSGNTYFWHFSNLQLFETMQVNVSLHVNLFINNAYSHIATANTGCVTGMVSATDTLRDIVFGSYDPNDKNVWPLIVREHNEFIADTQTLTYQINFQNTGNDTAFRVAIRDTLSQYLDISTIKMIAASHAYDVQLHNNQTLEWVFNNILLPDSHTNEPLSHGYVRFSIKPKKGIALNTVIENKAAIYFDYNDPIITNTVALQYVLRYSSVSEATEDKRLKLYPNPASDNLIIQTDAEAMCEIFIQTVTGEILLQQYAHVDNAKGHALSISGLPSGLYIIAVRNSDTGQTWYRKFCKL